jgi:hypothetical protein
MGIGNGHQGLGEELNVDALQGELDSRTQLEAVLVQAERLLVMVQHLLHPMRLAADLDPGFLQRLQGVANVG